MNRLRYIERVVRFDRARRKMVPAPEILNRDIKSVRNGDQRVAQFGDVVERMRHGCNSRHGNNQLITSVDQGVRIKVVG